MASLASRVPFLDHELVVFIASIPTKYEIKCLAGKVILKSAVEDLLPRNPLPTENGIPDAMGLLAGRSGTREPRTYAAGAAKRGSRAVQSGRCEAAVRGAPCGASRSCKSHLVAVEPGTVAASLPGRRADRRCRANATCWGCHELWIVRPAFELVDRITRCLETSSLPIFSPFGARLRRSTF